MNHFFSLPADFAQAATTNLFAASGSPASEACLMGERLIKANLTGHDSHGFIRAPQYMENLRENKVKSGQTVRFEKDHGACALLDGCWGYGQPAASAAMRIAIERATKFQVASVGVSQLFHIGRLADYALMAAEQGMIGMVFTSAGGGSSLVAPFGGNQRRMSTNPMAFAFPSQQPYPVVFDFASCALAEGKFRVMRDGNVPAPTGVLIDKNGEPSIHPPDLYDGGAILPLGGDQGYKGYMLNFLMETLGGLLTGGGFVGMKRDAPFNNCSFMIVVNVRAFRDLAAFQQEMGMLIKYLQATRSAPNNEVLAPGEKEARTEKIRKAKGIPLAQTTIERMQAELDRYRVKINLINQATVYTPPT